jgi:hypothetical protein
MTGLLQHVRRNLVAYLALLFALSSTGYAASSSLLPKNSVGSAQVINGSLQRADLSKKTVARLRGHAGPAGPIGLRGPSGPSGITSVTAVDSAPAAMCAAPGGGCQVAGPFATCPAGSVVVGGGWESDSIDLIVPYAKHPTPGSNYSVIAINYDTAAHTIKAHAICASGPGATAASTLEPATTASFEKALRNARRQLGR